MNYPTRGKTAQILTLDLPYS